MSPTRLAATGGEGRRHLGLVFEAGEVGGRLLEVLGARPRRRGLPAGLPVHNVPVERVDRHGHVARHLCHRRAEVLLDAAQQLVGAGRGDDEPSAGPMGAGDHGSARPPTSISL